MLCLGILLGLTNVPMFLNREQYQDSWVKSEQGGLSRSMFLYTAQPQRCYLGDFCIEVCNRWKVLNWWAIRTVYLASNLVSSIWTLICFRIIICFRNDTCIFLEATNLMSPLVQILAKFLGLCVEFYWRKLVKRSASFSLCSCCNPSIAGKWNMYCKLTSNMFCFQRLGWTIWWRPQNPRLSILMVMTTRALHFSQIYLNLKWKNLIRILWLSWQEEHMIWLAHAKESKSCWMGRNYL